MRQTGFFSLGEATSLGEGKLWIQTFKLRLKIDLVSYPARVEGLVNMFNKRTNTLLYKNMYLSHFILQRVDVSTVCERWVETGTDCYIDPNYSVNHSRTSSASWQVLLNQGRWGLQHQSSSLAPTLAFLWPADSTAAGTYLYSFIRPLASARLPLIYTGASLHWRLGQGSIYIFILLIVMPDRRGSLHHNYLWLLLWPYSCHNILPADPHDLNFLNHSWPSDRQVVSLMSSQGYFTFPYGHTKHNIHKRESGRKEKKKQTWTWVSSKRKKGEICDTFEQLFVDQQAISSVYSSEIPTKSPGMQGVDCSLQSTALFCPLLCSAFLPRLSASYDFCRLPCSVDCFFYSLLGPSFPRLLPVLWEISRAR